jgi:hypothetical protein
MSEPQRQLGWPAAATLIAALIGAAAAALAVGIDSPDKSHVLDESRYASAREISDVKARLAAIEVSTQQLRTELRSDIKEVRDLLGQLVGER